ncbi:DUF4873 domain-containing protein [Mycobacterium asiaticum]|uniref:DUF4873 domain-containing protein n=1 Tax=Mycobacterium asiaticum TaxID=1790 RepID=UPI000B1D6CCF|nr:DUF4873 domain-containing protein [Mycobacterium asiaticum]
MTTAQSLLVFGAGADADSVRSALQDAGVTGVTVLEKPLLRSVFEDSTGTWALYTADGDIVRAHVIVAAHPPADLPWTPNLPGHNEFGGDAFHAAAWDPHFHAAGRRIAVIGADSFAGHHLGRLVSCAESVTVFPHAPRRIVTDLQYWPARARNRLRRRRRAQRPGPQLGATIGAVTSTGIRTVDGVEHPVDTIIYGTGFALGAERALVGSRGLTLRDVWTDGMEPFFGVAVRGFPNCFFVSGPDRAVQVRYIAACVELMKRTGSVRIEVRRSSQQVFNERAQLGPAAPPPVSSAFELSASAPDYEDTYDGTATLEIDGTSQPVHVRLIGHLDPLDGNYHWQGTIFDALPEESVKRSRAATLSVGDHSAPARIVERTPWGTHSVAGVGKPPYAVSER